MLFFLVGEYRPYIRHMRSFSPTGHAVNAMFLLQVQMHDGQLLVSISSPVPLSNVIHHLEKSETIVVTALSDFVHNQRPHASSLSSSTLMTVYFYQRTKTGCKPSWWGTHAPDILQIHF